MDECHGVSDGKGHPSGVKSKPDLLGEDSLLCQTELFYFPPQGRTGDTENGCGLVPVTADGLQYFCDVVAFHLFQALQPDVIR